MTQHSAIRRFLQGLTRWLCYGGMFLVIPLMLLTSTEVVARGVWNRPVPGTLELSSYMLAMFVLLGVAYTYQVGGHVRVSMLTSRLPVWAAESLNILTSLLTLFIVVILAWQGWAEGVEEKAVSDMLRIPQWPFKLLVSLAGTLLALEIVWQVVDSVGRLALSRRAA